MSLRSEDYSGDLERGRGSQSRTLPRFMSVTAVARVFGVSDVTLYRAIAAGEFPAIRIRGRLIVPTRAIEAMADAAADRLGVVDAADWAVTEKGHGARPRAGGVA